MIYAIVALTVTAVLGLTTENGPILFQLLGDYAPPLLAILVLSGIVAASFSTASGAILATSAIAVRNLFGVRRVVVTEGPDPLLRWTRLAMIPICLVGVIIAIRVSQTGILLTLAFDLMLACLAGPFILGLFWRAGGAVAMLAGVAVGFGLRTTFLVLTPTMYGVPNDLLYIPNSLGTEWLDGWSTLIAAAVAIATYVIIALVRPRTEPEFAQEEAAVAELREEEAQAEPVPGVARSAAGHGRSTFDRQRELTGQRVAEAGEKAGGGVAARHRHGPEVVAGHAPALQQCVGGQEARWSRPAPSAPPGSRSGRRRRPARAAGAGCRTAGPQVPRLGADQRAVRAHQPLLGDECGRAVSG